MMMVGAVRFQSGLESIGNFAVQTVDQTADILSNVSNVIAETASSKFGDTVLPRELTDADCL